MKGLAENKSTLGPEEVRKSALALVMGALDNPNPILRCAAGEALGRMAQVVGEVTFIARMAQTSFDKYFLCSFVCMCHTYYSATLLSLVVIM